MNRKYKILIIGKENNELENKIAQEKNLVKTVDKSIAEWIIDYADLDFIYSEEIDEKLMKRFCNSYTIIPNALSKFAINNEINKTYVNDQFIGELVLENLSIIGKMDSFAQFLMVEILKAVLYANKEKVDLNSILQKMKNISERVSVDTNQTINKIIRKHYSQGNLIQELKYQLDAENITKQFFNKLINNIQNDIDKIEGFATEAKLYMDVKRIKLC